MTIKKRNLLAAFLGIGIGGIGFGLVTPVTVVLLEENKTPSWLTGFVTMISYLGVVLFSRLTGRLIDKFNIKKILVAGLLIWTVCSFGHIFWYNYYVLFAVKIFLGLGGTFVFISTEVLIISSSEPDKRGNNIGLYAVFLSIGIAIGTLLIWTVNLGSWVPFVIGSSVMLFVFLFQLFLLTDTQRADENINSEKMSIRMMPLISLLSSGVYGIFESSIIVAVPIYALRSGFTQNQVSFFLASFVTGGIILLFFLSRLSDKVSQYKLLLSISVTLSVFLTVPVYLDSFIFLIIAFFLIGGIVPAFYTIGLNYTASKVEHKYLAQANSFYIMMYGAGTILGPVLGAMLVEWNLHYGYWIFTSILCMCFFILFLIKR